MEEEKQKSIFTEGLILGALTLWGYLASYSLDKGINDYYGIPSYFTDLSLTSILGNIHTILIIGLFLYFFVVPIAKLILTKTHGLWTLWGLFTLFMVVLALGFGGSYDGNYLMIWGGVTLLGIFQIYLNEKGSKKSSSNITSNSTTGKNNKFKTIIWVLGGAILSLYWMVGIGKTVAKTEMEHLIINQNNQRLIVLGTYKDFFITAPVDLEKKVIRNKFKLVETKNAGEIEKIKTGLLAVEDPTEWPTEQKQEDQTPKIQTLSPKGE